jgi:exodeoxyribonuclease V gamma subunit
MFYLHISNRTENLLRHLAEVIRAGGRRSLFDTEVILIQSQGMERMISQFMATEFRSWCNFEYLLPLSFLTAVANKVGLPISPDSYDRDVLAWRIDGLLRVVDDKIFRPLHVYFSGGEADLKRFQLSRRLANIYDQYQMMRPDMLAGWKKGNIGTDHPAEKWQMALWHFLEEQAGDVPHRGALLHQVIERLKEQSNLSQLLPQRVSVFGLHIMPPLFMEYLQALSRHCDIHLYILSPCKHYWGDFDNKRRLFQKSLVRIKQGLPEIVDQWTQHPLLVSLGLQGRDFQEMLLKNIDFEIEFTSFTSPIDGSSPSVLHRIQSDLLEGQIGDKTSGTAVIDNSITIVSCHSRLREIEVLKDQLLGLLDTDSTLQLHDIVVMAPDIQEYASLIPAIFHDVQHSIADRSLRKRNNVIGAFMAFLDIFESRFSWTELLDLLKKEVVYPNFDLAATDLDIVQDWITAVGIRWGLSARQREEMGLPELGENTWSAGLDRLLMGYAINTDVFVCDILPFAGIEGGQAKILGSLCQFVGIFFQAQGDFRDDRSLADWSTLLLEYTEQLFGTGENIELLELRELLLSLKEVYSKFHVHPIHLKVIRAWLEQSTHEARSSSGFLRGCLTFCSMLPMRSIPFRVVCLLGLNHDEFPRNDQFATFDLMAPPRSRPGDRSYRADDRYQFLEAILSARDHLYISFIGRSIRSNEKVPPSVVVTELEEFLQNTYGVTDIVIEHPLHPFNSSYFSQETEKLFSYNRQYCETAVRLQHHKKNITPWWSGELAFSGKKILVHDLLSFYANPQRWFVKNCLRIKVDNDMQLPKDHEPFDIGSLDGYLIDQEIIDHYLEGKDPKLLLARLKAEGRWALGASGRLSFSEKHRELKIFADKISDLGMGNRLPDRVIDYEVGDYNLTGVLSNLYQNGVLLARYADLKGKDLLAGWIHHLLLPLVTDCVTSTRILARDRLVIFSGERVTGPDLEELLQIFLRGCREPSRFFIEPALTYIKQLHSIRATIAPIVKAKESVQKSLDNGYEPEWALLFSNMEADRILDDRFEAFCFNIMEPIWRAADVG